MNDEDEESEFEDFHSFDLDDQYDSYHNPVQELITNLSQLIPQLITDVTLHVYQRKRSKALASRLQEQPKRHRICVPVDAPPVVYVLPTMNIEEALQDIDTNIFLDNN